MAPTHEPGGYRHPPPAQGERLSPAHRPVLDLPAVEEPIATPSSPITETGPLPAFRDEFSLGYHIHMKDPDIILPHVSIPSLLYSTPPGTPQGAPGLRHTVDGAGGSGDSQPVPGRLGLRDQEGSVKREEGESSSQQGHQRME